MAGKRGNNEGTIARRIDGRWEARLSLSDGKRKCFYGKTRQEVQRKLEQAKRDVASGLPIVGDRQTFGQYLAGWLETAKHRLKHSAVRRYRTNIRCHILPALSSTSLSKLTAQQIQALYNSMLDNGLSPSTVQNVHTVVHSSLKEAVRLGLVQRNVADLVQAPRRRRAKKITFSEEMARRFLDVIKGDRLEALYILALTTGMREGELLGLGWGDVDQDKGIITVTTSLQEGEGEHRRILGDPKSDHSRRRIALTSLALAALKKHAILQAQERKERGQLWDKSYNLVFPNTLGRPMYPRHLVYRRFHPLLHRAGLPIIRFHDLRHTAATLLLGRGVHPKIVSEMLGHSRIAITLDMYSHVTPDMQEGAARVMDEIMQGKEDE